MATKKASTKKTDDMVKKEFEELLQFKSNIFEVKQANIVFVPVMSKKIDEKCTICNNLLVLVCVECEVRLEKLERDVTDYCPSLTGDCTHSFHGHCINKWIKTNNTCPMDRKTWKVSENK